jgi:hypothetical protein
MAVVTMLLVVGGCSQAQQSGTAESTSAASPTRSPATRSADPATPRQPTESITVPDISVTPSARGPVLGADVSWPQCPKGMGIPQKRSEGRPMPLDSARFVVLGLTNGPGFTPNPCLASQGQWVRDRHLMAAAYAVISYPADRTLAELGANGPYDGGTRIGALRNAGYQQALFNVDTMKRSELHSPIVWLDVEPVSVFEWSADKQANAAVVVGAARGYTDSGYQIGAYSTQTLWKTVVGDLSLGLPEWRAAGQTSRVEALRRCRPDRRFQGGEAVLAQWVESGRDLNITCPGTSRELYRWFHQY